MSCSAAEARGWPLGSSLKKEDMAMKKTRFNLRAPRGRRGPAAHVHPRRDPQPGLLPRLEALEQRVLLDAGILGPIPTQIDLDGAQGGRGDYHSELLVVVPGDLDTSGKVDDNDLSILLANWHRRGYQQPGDVNGNGLVDNEDLSLLLANWNRSVLPAGLAAAGAVEQMLAASNSWSEAFLEHVDPGRRLGHLLAIVANRGGGDVSVLLGAGDGTFAADQRFSVAPADATQQHIPEALVLADVNADGLQDVLTVTRIGLDSVVSVLLGGGDGTFGSAQTFAVGEASYAIAIGDVNGDGMPDVVTASAREDDVSLLLGLGDGTFAEQQRTAVGDNPTSVALVDMDSDGFLDVVASDRLGVSVLPGNGDGTFAVQQRFSTGVRTASNSDMAISDLNGDGALDVVLPDPDFTRSSVMVLLGDGDGSFLAMQRFDAGPRPSLAAIGDVDGDGIPDVVVTSLISGHLAVLLGLGGGDFSAPQLFVSGWIPGPASLADLNGDGNLDVVVTNRDDGVITVLLGTGVS